MNYNPTKPFWPRKVLGILFGLLFLGLGWFFGCAGAGPIVLDAPVADLEGGTTREVILCGTASDAPAGTVVVISTPAGDVEAVLDAAQSYSLVVCLQVGQSADIQYFDSNGDSISPITTVTRNVDDRTDICPDPTNQEPVCP